jgi:hypothetical protein
MNPQNIASVTSQNLFGIPSSYTIPGNESYTLSMGLAALAGGHHIPP